MHETKEIFDAPVMIRFQSQQIEKLLITDCFAGCHIPVPGTHFSGFKRNLQPVFRGTQSLFRLFSLCNVHADTGHTYGSSLLVADYLSFALHPDNSAVAAYPSVFNIIRSVLLNTMADSLLDPAPVVGMNGMEKALEPAVKLTRVHAVQGLQVSRPYYSIVRDIPLPGADSHCFEGKA